MSERLQHLISAVRRRWRLRLLLRGAAIIALAILIAVVGSTWAMDYFRFTATAVRVFQIAAWVAIATIAWIAIGRVIRRRASDAQVALYLEEHEPALEGRLLAAVRFDGTTDANVSRPLVDHLIADAVMRCESQPAWRTMERRGIATAASVLGATLLASLLLVALRPGFIASGAPFLNPFHATGARPYTIGVEPGDTTIARGADLAVVATLRGFTAAQTELVSRKTGTEEWERVSMLPDEAAGTLEAMVLGVRADMEYMVEAAGVRTPIYRVRVADIPWVSEISIEYRFPAYTGLGPQLQPGGDIAAIAGTIATVIVKSTLAVPAGTLVAYGRDTIALVPDTGGTLRGAVTVRESGEYRLLFAGAGGRMAAGSPSYAIEALADQPPQVTLTKPGRDADATSVDEVFIEAKAVDDIGVRRLELVYRVNGGPERNIELYGESARREVVAGHTVFLEEMNLRPGDVISYYAQALDGRADTTRALSDIYFLTIRPFDRAFREAEQQGMPGGEQPVDAGELSERQREIVAGTFRVQRDRTRTGEARFREDVAVLALAQGRLREDVATLNTRLRSRGVVGADTAMAKVAVALDSALLAMTSAETELGRREAQAALTPEQRALTFLQRAEAVFNRERQIARGNPQGGGGGGRQQNAEELADLFELELDRMRNQYESVERSRRDSSTAQLDETLERVRELARRQQQENERRRAQQSSGASSGSSAGQRRMAEEADSLARRLERLSRERQNEELGDAAQRLRDAAEQMRRSASSQGTSGNSALDRLREAQRELETGRASGLRQSVEEARERVRRLAQQQEQVQQDVNRLGEDPATRSQRAQRLAERKEGMAQDVGSLDDELERLSREAQQGQPQAAQRLRDAARALREGRVEDKIRYSRQLVQTNNPDVSRNFEEQIGADLDSLGRRLDAAASAIGESREDRVARALERARDVANALERMSEQGQGQGQNGEQGQEPGARGEQGQAGQQGQGQEGQGQQKGEQGQGQGQGQEGQRGQAGGAPRGGVPGTDARRQASREFQQQTRELRDIRDLLRREGVDVEDLEGLLNSMARADNFGIGSPRGREQLSLNIVPGLREFEFGVRRATLGAATLPRVGTEGTVPEAYRRAVADYYRRLAEPRR